MLVLSDGMEGPVLRENQKYYHPEQKVFAVDMVDTDIINKVDALRKHQLKKGKGRLSATPQEPAPPGPGWGT